MGNGVKEPDTSYAEEGAPPDRRLSTQQEPAEHATDKMLL